MGLANHYPTKQRTLGNMDIYQRISIFTRARDTLNLYDAGWHPCLTFGKFKSEDTKGILCLFLMISIRAKVIAEYTHDPSHCYVVFTISAIAPCWSQRYMLDKAWSYYDHKQYHFVFPHNPSSIYIISSGCLHRYCIADLCLQVPLLGTAHIQNLLSLELVSSRVWTGICI